MLPDSICAPFAIPLKHSSKSTKCGAKLYWPDWNACADSKKRCAIGCRIISCICVLSLLVRFDPTVTKQVINSRRQGRRSNVIVANFSYNKALLAMYLARFSDSWTNKQTAVSHKLKIKNFLKREFANWLTVSLTETPGRWQSRNK